jgi:hypothetical protein
MNNLSKLHNDITQQRKLSLLVTRDRARAGITELIAALVLRGPLFVVAANEWLPAYQLTRMIRRQTLEVRQTLNHLRTVRASTCYRLLDTLINIPPQGEPILVLDFLHTFYDPDIPLSTRLFKLRECCRYLHGLAFHRPIVVMTQEMAVEEYEQFIPSLHAIADRTIHFERQAELISQPVLF